MVTRGPEAAATAVDLADLRATARASSYTWFQDRAWLDQDMIVALITLLERWSAGPETFRCYLPDTRNLDEQALFKEIISRPTGLTFQQLAQLAGYTQYLVHSTEDIDPAAFNSWMRVVSNLATNTDYNRPEDLRRSFAGLRDLVPQMNDIFDHLAGPDGDVRGFFRDQVAEERIKAHLISFGDGWPERIDQAERHTYFRGQIGFLLRCSGIDLSEIDAELVRLDASSANELAGPFDHYFACAAKMFDDLVKDPNVAGRLWERALLAVGDFLPLVGRNHSLLTTAQDEAWSWKRLLRNAAAGGRPSQVLKDLWDRLEEPSTFADNLSTIIDSASDIDPWRKAILATPSVYEYGLYRMLRFADNGGVYILRKSQMNGRHAELFTYCLHENLMGESKPLALTISYYETTSTDEEPGLYLVTHFGGEEVKFYLSLGDSPDGYELYLEEPEEPSDQLRAILEDEGFEDRDGWLTKDVELTEMKPQVFSLAGALAQET